MEQGDHEVERDSPRRSPLPSGLGLRGRALLQLGVAFSLLIVLLVVIDTFGVPYTGVRGEMGDRREAALRSLDLLAQTKAERLLRWVDERHDDVTVVSGLAVVARLSAGLAEDIDDAATDGASMRAGTDGPLPPEARELTETLALVKRAYGVYESLAVVLAGSGTVVACTNAGEVGFDRSGSRAFQAALTTEDVVVVPGTRDRGPAIELARTIRSAEGDPLAVLVAIPSLDDALGPLLFTGDELGDTGQVLLVDGSGTLLAQTRRPDPIDASAGPVRDGITDRPMTLAAAGESGTIAGEDHRGVPVLAAYRALEVAPDVRWGVVVKQDVAEAMAPIRRRVVLNLVLGLFFSGLAVLAAAAVLTAETRPLRRLGDVADRVQRGDYDARATEDQPGEIRVLSSALNSMLDQLRPDHEVGAPEARHEDRDAATGRSSKARDATADGTVVDLDEARKSRGERARSADLFRELLDRSGDEIWVIDGDRRIVDVNETACRHVGYERGELEGADLLEIVVPEEGWDWGEILSRLERGETIVKRGIHRTKDGSTYPVEIAAVLIPEGGTDYIVAIARDLTARAEAEDKLHRLATAVEQSADTVMMTDTDGTIQYVNTAFEKTSGYERHEVLGRNPRFLKSGEHDDEYYRQMWETLERGEVWTGRFVNKRKDGTIYYEDATITPVFGADGEVDSYVAVKHDVTDAVRREEQLQQSQKLEAIGQLAAGIAHDFNNLLTGITGYSQLIAQHLGEGSSQAEDLSKVIWLSRRAAGLTRQLLLFSRRLPIEPVALDPNEVIERTMELVGRLIGEQIEVKLDLEPALGTVRADPAQLEQVLMNLCVNARDAMPSGGILKISSENVLVDDEFARTLVDLEPGPHVEIRVSDRGTGMSAETQERIFEPFFTTKESGEGTGLGLATVHGIVKQHGGGITVYSEPGHGTTFKIRLPRIDEKAQKLAKTLEDEAALPPGDETLLVVEDDDAVRGIVERILESAGYELLVAEDPKRALEIFDDHADRIDLVLSDMVMPGMHGTELYERLAERAPGLKVLFMSGYSDRRASMDSLTDKPFLHKPFTPARLAQRVRDVLDGEENEETTAADGATAPPAGGDRDNRDDG